MSGYLNRAGLQVASVLADYVETKALAGTGVSADALWSGLAGLMERFVPVNRTLLAKRDDFQAKLDAWHKANFGPVADMATKVDAQNADDALYEMLEGESIALKAARALVFEGVSQPSGYSEPLLHKFRQEKTGERN